MTIRPEAINMIIGLEMILWVWQDKDDYLMKTHMDHSEIFNISTNIEREFELHMLPPSKLELIRSQLSISYGKQVPLIKESTP